MNNFLRLFIAVILIESFNVLLFFGKGNIPLIFLLFVISLALVFRLNIFSKKLSNSKNLIGNIELSGSHSFFISLLFILIIFAFEIYLFDGRLSENSILLITFVFLFFNYNSIGDKFSSEKDFAIIFIGLLVLFFSIPEIIHKIVYDYRGTDSVEGISTEPYVETFLGIPLSKLLNLSGIYSFSSGQFLYYEESNSDMLSRVSIAKGCTGIMSVYVFLCALLSYMIVNKIENSLIILFSLIGILVAFCANLFRMFVIVYVGHLYGDDALKFTHTYLGWFIFVIWISIFFHLLTTLFKDYIHMSEGD